MPERDPVIRFRKKRLGATLLLGLVTVVPLLGQELGLSRTADSVTEEEENPVSAGWAPELLWGILISPNAEAAEALHRAAFAAGPAIVPQLEAALKDDRTAEFAAQTLAFIGGEQALQLLWRLVADSRDLNLRRFYYSALAEFEAPEATQTLLDVISRADEEPDRTVTEAAIVALTVWSDTALLPRLREMMEKTQDVVIRDDLDNAIAVIEHRARYLALPEAKQAGGSIEQAVRTYFMPALESPPELGPTESPTARPAPARALVKVEVQHLTLSPDKTRALARVVFEDPSAFAYYDIVLQKRYGNWAVASVWLGSAVEKAEPAPAPGPRERTP